MIEYIRGQVAELNPAAVVLESATGMAFRISITLATFSSIQNNTDTRLFIHEVIREDAWSLYGFAEERERELFRALIGVSGVGAATALLLLSSLPGEELATAIASGDVKRLKAVKGIGAKTAERIIVDLRDKVGESVSADTRAALPGMAVADFDEALAALTMLGFERKQSQKVLRALYDAEPGLKVEAAIKKALSMM